jgi:hypothetical protein
MLSIPALRAEFSTDCVPDQSVAVLVLLATSHCCAALVAAIAGRSVARSQIGVANVARSKPASNLQSL